MEDIDIVNLYWQRSETAIAETDGKYGRYCKRIANNVLSSAEDAEECVSDTWMSAWNAMPTQRPARLAAFLGRITRNLALDRHDRRTAKKRGGNSFDALLSELEDCLPAPDTVEAAADRNECAAQISVFLRGIDHDSRDTFLRRYWFADSIADIARRFGMSGSKVKSMLFRTRGRLREHLAKEGILI